MKKKIRKVGVFIYYLINPIVDPIKFLSIVPRYLSFWKDFFRYISFKNSPKINLLDLYPIINDKTSKTKFDAQYFHQGIWAFNKILKSKVMEHVDIGSQIDLVGFLTTITNVKFVDIRPLKTDIDNFVSIKGDILNLPFKNNSILSLSCLHVAEHIGLGRYGDLLDPLGTEKACRELSRVLSLGGSLYFSLPIGKPRVCFNAHRIHLIKQILHYFNKLELKELVIINDKGKVIKDPKLEYFDDAVYSAGLFHFKKIVL